MSKVLAVSLLGSRGKESSECRWMEANHIDSTLVPADQTVTIELSPAGRPFIHFQSWAKDASGGVVQDMNTSDRKPLRIPLGVLCTKPPQDFGITPEEVEGSE